MKIVNPLLVGVVISILGFMVMVALGFLYSLMLGLAYDFELALTFGVKNGAICGLIAFLVSLIGGPRPRRRNKKSETGAV